MDEEVNAVSIIKSGKYICIASSGLMLKGKFLKLNTTFELTEADIELDEVKEKIKQNLIKFAGPVGSSPVPEKGVGNPVAVVDPAPKSKPQNQSGKTKT